MISTLRPKLHRTFLTVFLGLFLLMGFGNIFKLSQEIQKTYRLRKVIPFSFLGFKFAGIEKLFRHVKYLGYYTDKDLVHDNIAAAQFAQAQYVLAPTILDPTSTQHTFVIFDCTNEAVAQSKIKELGFTPLKSNKFGIILAGKKP